MRMEMSKNILVTGSEGSLMICNPSFTSTTSSELIILLDIKY